MPEYVDSGFSFLDFSSVVAVHNPCTAAVVEATASVRRWSLSALRRPARPRQRSRGVERKMGCELTRESIREVEREKKEWKEERGGVGLYEFVWLPLDYGQVRHAIAARLLLLGCVLMASAGLLAAEMLH
ncbi:hypothetical protein Dimus_008345 [Dionaea muscipula]